MTDALQADVEENTHEGKFLSFPLADSLYGIDIQYVVEVVIRTNSIKITHVPNMPAHTRGVINLRGKVIPVIDLRTRFQLPPRDYDNRTCFVVVHLQEVVTGLIVDTVSGVVSIPKTEIDPAPQLETALQSRFIAGMGKTKEEVYILLDLNQLLQKEELRQLQLGARG